MQRGLLESAFHALKPGGVLVYSTCTLSLQENQAVCQSLQEKFGDAFSFDSLADLFPGAEKACTPEGYLHVWPQIFDSEGFFVARLRKASLRAQHHVQTGQARQVPLLAAARERGWPHAAGD